MKKLFICLGLFVVGAVSTLTASTKETECTLTYRFIDRYLCGDVLNGTSVVPAPTVLCGQTIDVISQPDTPIACTNMHPPGGRY